MTSLVLTNNDFNKNGFEDSKPSWNNTSIINGFATPRLAGIWFSNATIPAGATINSATLDTINVGGGGASAGRLYGVAADNFAGFSISALPSAQTKTTAFVSLDAGTFSYDVTAIVAEIVARGGWSSGNNLAFAGDPTGISGGSNWNVTNSNGSTPTLTINYTAAGASPNKNLMMMGVGQ